MILNVGEGTVNSWENLLCEKRFGDILCRPKASGGPEPLEFAKGQFRLPQERDHDRILFSTPFRRMGDKTQVFPLESIESIRTRLTHSYEVGNLARSLGVEIATGNYSGLPKDALRSIPAVLAAVGLAHDIGNPPFGHQGEHAIRSWFVRNQGVLFEAEEDKCCPEIANDIAKLTEQHKNDFLVFEGNAQTLRVLTKLQVIGDDLGLNLTVGTLASLMKYVVGSHQLNSSKKATKKVGFFASEQQLVEKIRTETKLNNLARHPLALVMEACDDIAYSVLDAEDSIKKGIVSFNDLLATLQHKVSVENPDLVIRHLCKLAKWEYDILRDQKLHPSELQDVATQKFRVHAIHLMVCAVAEAFQKNYSALMNGTFEEELIAVSKAAELRDALQAFNQENTFSHKTVLEVELNGYNVINRLMDFLWIGISNRKEYNDLGSRRTDPFATYVYSRISKNHRRVFEGAVTQYHADNGLPIRYKELQLLTDMISGMTDQFCIDLHDDLDQHFRESKLFDGTSS